MGAHVESVNAPRLVSVDTDIAVNQEMAGLELLEDDRGFLHNFLPIGRGTDVKENTHHHHVVSSQFLPLSLMHYTLHGRHPAERLP